MFNTNYDKLWSLKENENLWDRMKYMYFQWHFILWNCTCVTMKHHSFTPARENSNFLLQYNPVILVICYPLCNGISLLSREIWIQSVKSQQFLEIISSQMRMRLLHWMIESKQIISAPPDLDCQRPNLICRTLKSWIIYHHGDNLPRGSLSRLICCPFSWYTNFSPTLVLFKFSKCLPETYWS